MSLPVALCLLLHRDQVFPRLQIEPHYFLNGVYCKVMALIEYLIAGSYLFVVMTWIGLLRSCWTVASWAYQVIKNLGLSGG